MIQFEVNMAKRQYQCDERGAPLWAPKWYRKFVRFAQDQFSLSSIEPPLETALGVYPLIREGQREEAKHLCEQARQAVIIAHMTGIPMETRSNQIRALLADKNGYGPLRAKSAEFFRIKYGQGPLQRV